MPDLDLGEFYVDLDRRATPTAWRIYHEPCAVEILAGARSGYDLDDLAGMMRAHVCPTVSPVEALDWAIFAVNNHTDPDASTEDDVAQLEAKAPLVLTALTRLRGFHQDDVSIATSYGTIPHDVAGPDFKADTEDPAMASLHRAGEKARAKDAAEIESKVQPLSDFAIHVGLIPRGGRPTGLWVDGDQTHGQSVVDWPVPGMPGLYLDGTWTEWGEGSNSDNTSHLVYRLESVQADNFAAVMGGLLAYLRENSTGRLTDWAAITLAQDYAEKVGVIPLVDYQAEPAIPSDWRTR